MDIKWNLKTCCALLLYFSTFYYVSATWITWKENSVARDKKYKVDYFVLAMEWPEGTCEYVNSTGRHECVISDRVKGWVLHGLWPSSFESRYLQYCNHSIKFDFNKIRDLQDRLLRYWPNLFRDSSKNFLWKHEYEKHGSCAALLEGFESEREYFMKAMELLQKFDPGKVLAAEDVVPSEDAYDSEKVIGAFRSAYVKRVCTQCSYYDDFQVLSGVEVCLSTQLELMECPDCGHKYRCDGSVFYHPLHFDNSKFGIF